MEEGAEFRSKGVEVLPCGKRNKYTCVGGDTVYLWRWGHGTGRDGMPTAQVGGYYIAVGLRHQTGVAVSYEIHELPGLAFNLHAP